MGNLNCKYCKNYKEDKNEVLISNNLIDNNLNSNEKENSIDNNLNSSGKNEIFSSENNNNNKSFSTSLKTTF